MKVIGMALIFIGFLDFGLYLLSLVSSFSLNFMPEVLVLGSKDYTDVAVIFIGYFLKGIGENKESSTDTDTETTEENKN